MTALLPLSDPIVFVLSVLGKGAAVLGLTAGLSWALRNRAVVRRRAAC